MRISLPVIMKEIKCPHSSFIERQPTAFRATQKGKKPKQAKKTATQACHLDTVYTVWAPRSYQVFIISCWKGWQAFYYTSATRCLKILQNTILFQAWWICSFFKYQQGWNFIFPDRMCTFTLTEGSSTAEYIYSEVSEIILMCSWYKQVPACVYHMCLAEPKVDMNGVTSTW